MSVAGLDARKRKFIIILFYLDSKKKKKNKVSHVSSPLNLEGLLIDLGTRMQAVADVAADAIKYCEDILDDLGPLCAYEASKILLEQLSMHPFFSLCSNFRTVKKFSKKITNHSQKESSKKLNFLFVK